jgi:hypothetical protein
MKGSDIISVLFLALVCIVIAGCILRIAPKSLIIPSFALISICLWIAYDFMMLKRYRMKLKKVSLEKEIRDDVIDINADTEINADKPPPTKDDVNNDVPADKSEQQYDAEIEKHLYELDAGLSSKSGKQESVFKYPKSREDGHTSLLKPLPNLIDVMAADNGLMPDINVGAQAGYPFDLTEQKLFNTNSSHIYSGQQSYDGQNDNEGTHRSLPTDIANSYGNSFTNQSYIDIPKVVYEKDIERKQHKNEFDIDMYSGYSNIKELHPMMGGTADTKLANRMKYMQMQSKLSADIRAAHHKPQMQVYLEEELRETYEQRHWWENDQLNSSF